MSRGLMILLAVAAAVGANAVEPAVEPDEIVTWRIELANDILFNSDDQYSNGWSVQKHGALSNSWADAGGTAAFGKPLARLFLPDDRKDLLFREGWTIGHNLQTPTDLSQEALIETDVPYAASLAVMNNWIAFDDDSFEGFGWLIGIVGPAALGEEIQKPIHELVNSPEPMGWDNQLHNEPLLNIYYQRKHKQLEKPAFDLTTGFGFGAGNLLTGADLLLETRFGRNMPQGFVHVPDPTGRSLAYDAHLPPPRPTRSVLYYSIVVRAAWFGQLLFLDGNTFKESHSVEREDVVGELILGLHYQKPKWGLHFSWWFTTDTFDPGPEAAEAGLSNNFASVMFELRR